MRNKINFNKIMEANMKSFLRTSLLLFVLVTLTACSGFSNKSNFENYSENVTLTFRAADNVVGGKLTLKATGGINKTLTETIVAGKDLYHFDFGTVPIGKTIDFYANIVMPDGSLLYEGTSSKKISSGKNSVRLMMDPLSGYFLWRRQKSNIGSCEVIYTNPVAGQNIVTPINFNVTDFGFAKNGTIWCVDNNGDIASIKHGTSTFEIKQQTMTGLMTIAVGEKLIFAGGSDSSTSAPTLYCFDNDAGKKTLTPKDVSDSVVNLGIEQVSEMAVSGSDIYIGTNIQDPDHPDNFSYKIFKGKIDESSKSVTFSSKTPIFDSTNKNEFGAGASFAITDMQIVDGNLYVLAIDKGSGMVKSKESGSSANSRGALIKINGSSYEVKYLHSNVSELDSPPEFSQDEHNYMLKEGAVEFQTCLIGPRKFIAVVPKKLVIADDGAVYDNATDKNIKSKKRIVTVNLDDFSFESVDVNEELFNGEITGCGFYSLKRE